MFGLLGFLALSHVTAGEWLTQVDASGRAWVAGRTSNSLDGHTNAGGEDIFLMTFDGDGNHLWTRQRGGPGADGARALQVGLGSGGDGRAELVCAFCVVGLGSCCLIYCPHGTK